MNTVIAAGALGLSFLTGIVIAVAYMHREFENKRDAEHRAERWEADMRYIRERIDGIADGLRGR